MLAASGFWNGTTLLLDLLLTRIAIPIENSSCVSDIFNSFLHSPTLLVLNDKHVPQALSLLPTENVTFVIIDENYDRHFSKTNLRVNSIVIFLECQQNSEKYLETIKKNRLLTTVARVIFFLDVGCQDNPEDVGMEMVKTTHQILKPAYVGTLTFNGTSNLNFFWSPWFNTSAVVRLPDVLRCVLEVPEDHFQGYELKVVATPVPPYVEATERKGIFTGIEIEIICAISDKMGMHLVWKECPPGEIPRSMRKNQDGHHVGFVGMLEEHKADVALGGMGYIQERFHVVEMVIPYVDDMVSWAIAAPPFGQNFGAITSVFSPFLRVLVAAVLASFFLTLTSFYFYTSSSLTISESFLTAFSTTFAVFFEQSITVRSKSIAVSFVFLFYVLYCLVITNAYRSSLITALMAEKEGKWFETPQEVVDAGEIVYIFETRKAMHEEKAEEDPMWKTIMMPGNHKFVTDFSVVKEIAETRHGMLLCAHLSCLFTIHTLVAMGEFKKPKVIFLKQSENKFLTSFMMAPGSPLFPAINKRVSWLLEADLINHWLDQAILLRQLSTYNRRRKEQGPLNNTGPRKLTMSHLAMTFVMLLFSLFLSFGLFIAEFAVKRFSQ